MITKFILFISIFYITKKVLIRVLSKKNPKNNFKLNLEF